VELHGGTVTVESEGPGLGSVFSVELTAAKTAGRAPSSPPPGRLTFRTLIIEDNADMAETLSELLALVGHDVVAVTGDGPSGVERALELRPEVVLCDLGLPGDFDGFEVALRIRSQLADASPILLAVTGYGSAEIRQRAERVGFDACLVKPVTLEHLQLQLARLDRRR
jgi:CheY-like chemotaxis protein